MKTFPKNSSKFAMICASAAAAFIGVQSINAGGSPVWFTPLTESAPVTAPNSMEELDAPWVTPEGIVQTNLVSLREVEDAVLSPGQSIIRVPDELMMSPYQSSDRRSGASMIDMMAFDDSGEFLFLPHETWTGAGVSRYDMVERSSQVLFQGDMKAAEGDWSNDYGAFDPCRFTPNGTLWLGEEWSGEGRVIEVMNPFAAPEDIEIRELHSIANVSHEGIQFSQKDKRPVYYVDENNSGSIYKFVRTTEDDYTMGQTFVLVVDAFAGDPSESYSSAANASQPRTGMATWVPITDAYNAPLPGITDAFTLTDELSRPGRQAADDVNGTPYGRPEDMEVGRLRAMNGANSRSEVLYFTATSEARVYSVEIISSTKAIVGVLADRSTPKNLGFAPTTGILDSPDNLATDSAGNVYIIEDKPNGGSAGGDIWFVRDADNDGVAESLDHFMSIRADGCEATGMIFNPAVSTQFVVAVQHPDSTNLTNVPNGLGDSVWAFDLSYVPNQAFVKQLKTAK